MTPPLIYQKKNAIPKEGSRMQKFPMNKMGNEQIRDPLDQTYSRD